VFPEVFHPGLFLGATLLLDAIEDLEPETGIRSSPDAETDLRGGNLRVRVCTFSSPNASEVKPRLKLAKNDHGRKSNAYRERQSGKHFSPLQHLEPKIAANQNACESSEIG